jgi:hypothetical protein
MANQASYLRRLTHHLQKQFSYDRPAFYICSFFSFIWDDQTMGRGGMQPLGMQPLGTQPLGTQPLGMQPLGVRLSLLDKGAKMSPFTSRIAMYQLNAPCQAA